MHGVGHLRGRIAAGRRLGQGWRPSARRCQGVGSRNHADRAPARLKAHVAVVADVGDPARSVYVPNHKIGAPRCRDGRRGVYLEFRPRSGKDLSDQRAHLAVNEIDDHAAHVAGGIVNVLSDFDAAVLTDCEDTVVVQESLGAGFLVGFDGIAKQDGVLEFDRCGGAGWRTSDGDAAFNGGKDADVFLDGRLSGRLFCDCRRCQAEGTSKDCDEREPLGGESGHGFHRSSNER